jgi:hypothetical protein
MIIKQNEKDGSGEIHFSWKEIWILIKKRKLLLTAESMKFLANSLAKIAMEFQVNFDPELQKKITHKNLKDNNIVKDSDE